MNGNSTSAFVAVTAIFINLAIGPAHGEEPAKSVDLPLTIMEGQKKKISYTRQVEKSQDGKKESETANISAIIEVTSRTEDSFIASWTTESVELNGLVVDKNTPEAATYLIGVPLEFEAANDGTPLQILNADSILDDVFQSKWMKDVGDSNALDAVRNMFTNMSPDVLAQVLLKAPSFISICQGTNLVAGELVEYETELPNPLGNSSLPAIGSYLLLSAPSSDGVAKIEWRQTVDPIDGKASLLAGIKSLVEASGADAGSLDELDNYPLELTYAANCDVGDNDGWVRTMTYSTIISLSIAERRDEWTISIADIK